MYFGRYLEKYLLEGKYTSSILGMYTLYNTSADILKNYLLEGKYTLSIYLYFKYTCVETGKIYASREVDFKYTLNMYFKYTFLIHSEA